MPKPRTGARGDPDRTCSNCSHWHSSPPWDGGCRRFPVPTQSGPRGWCGEWESVIERWPTSKRKDPIGHKPSAQVVNELLIKPEVKESEWGDKEQEAYKKKCREKWEAWGEGFFAGTGGKGATSPSQQDAAAFNSGHVAGWNAGYKVGIKVGENKCG